MEIDVADHQETTNWLLLDDNPPSRNEMNYNDSRWQRRKAVMMDNSANTRRKRDDYSTASSTHLGVITQDPEHVSLRHVKESPQPHRNEFNGSTLSHCSTTRTFVTGQAPVISQTSRIGTGRAQTQSTHYHHKGSTGTSQTGPEARQKKTPRGPDQEKITSVEGHAILQFYNSEQIAAIWTQANPTIWLGKPTSSLGCPDQLKLEIPPSAVLCRPSSDHTRLLWSDGT